jgi:hypothetical protein
MGRAAEYRAGCRMAALANWSDRGLTITDDRAGPRVAAVLSGLAERRASGALEVDGQPGGVVYLDRGEITFAQSDWSPDLTARLRGTLPQGPGLRVLLALGQQPGTDLGAQLIGGGHASASELQSILRSVILDAMIVLTVPLADQTTLAGTRMVEGSSHWAGSLVRLSVASVQAEAARLADRMAGCELARAVRLQLRDLSRGPSVLTRAQWAVASMMDGSYSARDLAWESGQPLYETVEHVGDLVRAGLCAPSADAPPSAGAPRSAAAPLSADAPAAAPESAAPDSTARAVGRATRQDRQQPEASAALAGDPAADAGPDAAGRPEGAEFTPVSVDALRRVLDGLRKLS